MGAEIPVSDGLQPGMAAALLSFGYNLGYGFYGSAGFDTISSYLTYKRYSMIPYALMLYRNPGTSVEVGLGRRRDAEGEVWMGELVDEAIATAQRIDAPTDCEEVEHAKKAAGAVPPKPLPPEPMTINLHDFFEYYEGSEHQYEAVSQLQAAMPASLLKDDSAHTKHTCLLYTSPSPRDS